MVENFENFERERAQELVIVVMDYRSQEDDSMGCLPSTYNNPTPPQNPQNPVRVSAFSKPSPLLSPRLVDHSIRNGSTTHDFTNNPISPSPVAAAAAAAAAGGGGGATTPKTPPAAAAAIKYRDCLRNHAAAIGGHVLDGCCEFMPCDSDPLRCAACDCHRSFHRKYDPGSEHIIGSTTSSAYYHHRRDRISVPLLLPPPHPTSAHHGHPSQTYHHQPQPHSHSHSHSQKQQFASSATFPPSPSGVIPGGANPAVVAFGGMGGNNSGSGATTESSSEERMDGSTEPSTATAIQHLGLQQQQTIVSKKRFRTKFTPEQKEKLMGFAERVGWRIQRQDDATVEHFCREIGVRRQVLKVWMHNNKHSIKKQQQQEEQQQQQQPQPQSQPQPQIQQQLPAPLGM